VGVILHYSFEGIGCSKNMFRNKKSIRHRWKYKHKVLAKLAWNGFMYWTQVTQLQYGVMAITIIEEVVHKGVTQPPLIFAILWWASVVSCFVVVVVVVVVLILKYGVGRVEDITSYRQHESHVLDNTCDICNIMIGKIH
jgi:hypothetical protein